MSVSGTTTETKSRTSVSQPSASTDRDDIILDRWTNNITYRQLVISSCIGVLQIWWHPYVHDLTKLLPFMFLYSGVSFFVGYPMFYMELALGVVTKRSVLGCWNISPSMRGFGITMQINCIYTALATSAVGAYSLVMCVHSLHTFLPWLHCAANSRPACAARHRIADADTDTPAQSFFTNFVLSMSRDSNVGLSDRVWDLTAYYVICWLPIYFIASKRIYSYSKMVLFKDLLACFTLFCCVVGVLQLDGVGRVFTMADFRILGDFQFWREAVEFSLLQMSVGTGTLVMLGSYCPGDKHKLGITSLVTFTLSKVMTMASALVLGGVHGALMKDYDNITNVMAGGSASMVLWADFVVRVPGSQFWSLLVFFTIFVLALSSTALLVQTLVSSLDVKPLRHMMWVVVIAVCVLFCYIGAVSLCAKGGIYVLNSLMAWPVCRPRLMIAGVTAIVVSYMFGQRAFCESVFYAVAEYPCLYLRLCWATVPIVLIIFFTLGFGVTPPDSTLDLIGWILVITSLVPTWVVQLFYILFKCRVRNMVTQK